MNYKAHYNTLIERARTRLLEGYSERHHVVPVCMGGGNETENIVRLTAAEHYVAHQLLVKIYPDNSRLAKAAYMMTVDNNGERVTNRLYGWLKEKNSKAQSKLMTGSIPWNKGKNNAYSAESKDKISKSLKIYHANNDHQRGMLGKKHTEETKIKMSESRTGKSNAFYGKKHTEETKQKISKALKGKVGWFNNGCEECYVKINSAPAGWIRGRTCKTLKEKI